LIVLGNLSETERESSSRRNVEVCWLSFTYLEFERSEF